MNKQANGKRLNKFGTFGISVVQIAALKVRQFAIWRRDLIDGVWGFGGLRVFEVRRFRISTRKPEKPEKPEKPQTYTSWNCNFDKLL
jgi:hypothetical protein